MPHCWKSHVTAHKFVSDHALSSSSNKLIVSSLKRHANTFIIKMWKPGTFTHVQYALCRQTDYHAIFLNGKAPFSKIVVSRKFSFYNLPFFLEICHNTCFAHYFSINLSVSLDMHSFGTCIIFRTNTALDSRFLIWASAWDFQQCGMCDQQSLRSACAYAQSDQSLC